MKSIFDFSSPNLVDGECVRVLVGMVSKELCEPSLSQTEEQEQREQERCKKGLSLLKVIKGVCSNLNCNCSKVIASLDSVLFHNEEVLENILSLLRHDDVTIGNVISCDLTCGHHVTLYSGMWCPDHDKCWESIAREV